MEDVMLYRLEMVIPKGRTEVRIQSDIVARPERRAPLASLLDTGGQPVRLSARLVVKASLAQIFVSRQVVLPIEHSRIEGDLVTIGCHGFLVGTASSQRGRLGSGEQRARTHPP